MRDDLTVQVKGDGVWLDFKTKDGSSTRLNILALAEGRPPIVREVLAQWVLERIEEAAKKPN